MTRFRYTALDVAGETRTGTVEAATDAEARAQLEGEGLQVLTLQPATEQGESESSPLSDFYEEQQAPAGVQLSEDDFLAFGDALGHVTGAGLPLESGLRVLAEQVPSRRTSRSLEALSGRLERGETWEAIVADPRTSIPAPFDAILRLPFSTEQLAGALVQSVEHLRRAAAVRRRIWFGLAYSLLLLGAAASTLVFIVIAIIPEFADIFDGFGMDLPELTEFVISVSWLVSGNLAAIGGAAAGLVLIAGFLLYAAGPVARRRLACATPLLGKAWRYASLATFCCLLAEMVQRSAPLPAALRFAGAGSRDAQLRAGCEAIIADLERGRSLAEAARPRLEFPETVLHVFRSADEPASFCEALQSMGNAYESQAAQRARLTSIALEPMILMGIGTVLVLVVVSLFLPLTKLLNDLS